MFHREGYTIIILTVIIGSAMLLYTSMYLDTAWMRYLVYILVIVLIIAVLQFFRNPKRTITTNDGQILSPVDGKVVVIEEVFEKEIFNEKRLQVSIFMSPVNVHVTRYPASGEITYSKYHPGKFLVAWHPKASEENERTSVVIQTKQFGAILYRQIAGALAKRIVNYAQEGEMISQGEDSGFIKFGSRVDLFLPLDTKLEVSLNQKVKGAQSIIATS